MAEFFNVLPRRGVRGMAGAGGSSGGVELIAPLEALGRGRLQRKRSRPTRSTVDGYAVRAADTFGASDSLPAYLTVAGEVPMGQAASVAVAKGQAVLIHTGGMLPPGADAVVMVEHTQLFGDGEIEVLRPVAPGENVLQVGEDVDGAEVLPAGHPSSRRTSALLALGLAADAVVRRPRVCLFSSERRYRRPP